MLESNVSVGDTCKEIGVTRPSSYNAAFGRWYNAGGRGGESKFRAIADANRL